MNNKTDQEPQYEEIISEKFIAFLREIAPILGDWGMGLKDKQITEQEYRNDQHN